MATKQRIYLVKTPDGTTRLVRATVRSQALAHVASTLMEVRIPTPEETFAAGAAGIKIEDFKNPDQLELNA